MDIQQNSQSACKRTKLVPLKFRKMTNKREALYEYVAADCSYKVNKQRNEFHNDPAQSTLTLCGASAGKINHLQLVPLPSLSLSL